MGPDRRALWSTDLGNSALAEFQPLYTSLESYFLAKLWSLVLLECLALVQ